MSTIWLIVVLLSSGHVNGGEVGVGSPGFEPVVGEPLGSSAASEVDDTAVEAVLDEGAAVSVVVVTIFAAAVLVSVKVVVVRSNALMV